MKNFEDLGIHSNFIKALDELKIKVPSEIQELSIPYLLEEGKDFIGMAQTGTGKTAAYGLPLLQKVDPNNPKPQALVLSPTRELGQQIAKQLFKFTKYSDKIFTEAVYGGEKIEKQIGALTRPTQIIVATPGRLVDLLERGAVDIRQVKYVVLDEADEMLSMGFKKSLDTILSQTGKQKSTWLFSATMPEGIRRIVHKYMATNARKVEVNKKVQVNANILHQYIVCEIDEKAGVIRDFVEKINGERGMIFCRTKAGAQKVAEELKEEGLDADSIHGDLGQKERDKVMRAFKNRKLQLLVATDVIARGIDVQNLSFVIQHQLPERLEYYTHRSGRTARAGKKGVSLSLVTPSDKVEISKIQNQLGIEFTERKLF